MLRLRVRLRSLMLLVLLVAIGLQVIATRQRWKRYAQEAAVHAQQAAILDQESSLYQQLADLEQAQAKFSAQSAREAAQFMKYKKEIGEWSIGWHDWARECRQDMERSYRYEVNAERDRHKANDCLRQAAEQVRLKHVYETRW